MKNNFIEKIISVMLLTVILAGIFVPANFCITAEAKNNDVESVIDNIIKWKNNSAQSIADEISDSMGNSISDWYAISLSRYKYNTNFSKCIASLDKYTISQKNLSATDMQRIAITYTAMGSKSDFINTALNNSIGKLGIMSYSYGLIMLDCGAYYGNMTRDEIINKILSMQFSDGGWGLMQSSDVDVTAITIQALARYYKHSDVKNALNKALSYLSKKQQPDGDFTNYGTANAESTAQVLLALNAMKINYKTDNRFIKNSNTVYDGLLKYQKSDGSFSHVHGSDSNQIATVQSLYALISLWRFQNEKTSFFEFVNNSIQREVNQNSNTESSRTDDISSKPDSSDNTKPNSTVNNPVSSQEFCSNQNSNQNSYASSSISRNSRIEFSTVTSETVENSSKSNSEPSETTSLESYITERNETTESGELSKDNKTSSEISKTSETQTFNYNIIIPLCLVGILGITLVVLFVCKKANKKNIIVIVIGFAVLIVISFTIKIETPNQYYSEIYTDKQNTSTVIMSISCTNALGKTNNDKIPENGIILDDTEISVSDGETVFDILIAVCKKNKILIDYDGNNETVYIKGIGGLYEFDCGELSGWIYKVNGKTPNVGCSNYIPKNDDIIEWVYTTNLGKELE